MEELEAIDWYQQRVDAAGDAALKDVLAHNRDEEIEHAVMTLEWIRRHNPVFDARLREYLFTDGSITARESEAEAGKATDGAGRRSSVGSLRGGR
jgi:ferritin-like protein